MKNIHSLSLVLAILLSTAPSWSQYKIDLSKKQTPALSTLQLGDKGPAGREVEVNNLYMAIGGEPVLPVMGEFHFSRYNHRFWRDALLKMKASGVNIVATYVLWIYHEEIEGRPDWTGNNNLRAFIELCGELGMLVHLRAGPYCNAEARNGGFPDWLKDKGAELRTNDPLYLAYARKWYREVYSQVKGLLYKDGGPVMALQIENEFVNPGLLISHIVNLKKIAVEEGFDVPVYSMTHWMSVDYPEGEIVPYAGYYIETPWINSGKKEIPVSNFQFFSYNRISDNIGTDIIKHTGNTESLISEDNTSPYFTCEVGVGTPSFYYRRPIVPKEMAGANINLRLGCGVNLMGYYMYVGGTNRVGQRTTLESSTGRVSYDYQAPVREFGNWGAVMEETKKFNYLMNDFGRQLAPAVAYLPTSNKDTANLQWAVRLHRNDGFLFCSNYLYKHSRKDYKNVQFNLNLKGEKLAIPRKPVTIKNGDFFAWPFNQALGGILLKYSTTQPICKHTGQQAETYFFFANGQIPAEYLIGEENIRDIKAAGGDVEHKNKQYYINRLAPGKECVIEITKNDGKKIRLITLTGEESDEIWKGRVNGKDFVAFTRSGLLYDDAGLVLAGESPVQDIWIYENEFKETPTAVKAGLYTRYGFEKPAERLTAGYRKLSPMEGAGWIAADKPVWKEFDGATLSSAESLTLRCKSDGNATCYFNNEAVPLANRGNYSETDLTRLFINGKNTLRFAAETPCSIIAEIEVLLKNGTRWTWQTDNTWITGERTPVEVKRDQAPVEWNGDETIAWYVVETPELHHHFPEVRLNIGFSGDRADAYIGGSLVGDYLFDGADWIFGINRYHDALLSNPLLLRIKGFNEKEPAIYFEKGTDMKNCMYPVIDHIHVKKEYRFGLEESEPALVPYPKKVELSAQNISFDIGNFGISADSSAARLCRVMKDDLYRLSGVRVKDNADAFIYLSVDARLEENAYRVQTAAKRIDITGGSYHAVAMGWTTLLQSAGIDAGRVSVRVMDINDRPDLEYRGYMLDLARQFHSHHVVKQMIDVCRWYKIRYMQLHLSDEGMLVYPTKQFPKMLKEGSYYTPEQLEEIVAYAHDRGVVLVPELEGPGHSRVLRAAYPGLFGPADYDVIDISDPEAIDAVKVLAGEIMESFPHSPYFHIGADEVNLSVLETVPHVKQRMAEKGYETVHDFYLNYLSELHRFVKSRGKQTLVWEGFNHDGSARVKVPKDIAVCAFETLFQRPDSLAGNGYQIINTSWKPLYITPNRRWSPEKIYNWNYYTWENFWEKTPAAKAPIVLDGTRREKIRGAQMCAWEMPEEMEYPAIHKRLAALGERLWNTTHAGNYQQFEKRMLECETKLKNLIYPMSISAEGLTGAYQGEYANRENYFAGQLILTIKPKLAGTELRYTTDRTFPSPESAMVPEKLVFDNTTFVKLALYDANGVLLSYYPAVFEKRPLVVAFPGENHNSNNPDRCITFDESLKVKITMLQPGGSVRYTLDGSEPLMSSPEYASEIPVSSVCGLRIQYFDQNGKATGEPYGYFLCPQKEWYELLRFDYRW